MTLPELQRLLAVHGFQAARVQLEGAWTLEVTRLEASEKKRMFGLGGSRKTEISVPSVRLPIPGPDGLVSLNSLREIRKACHLEVAEFYDPKARIGSFIHQYQTLLVKLGRL